MSLQIVIRSKRGSYVAINGQWAERVTSALSFASMAEAEAFCRKEKFRDIEIVVLRSGRPPMRVPFGITTETGPSEVPTTSR